MDFSMELRGFPTRSKKGTGEESIEGVENCCFTRNIESEIQANFCIFLSSLVNSEVYLPPNDRLNSNVYVFELGLGSVRNIPK
jgi:hypothetical protein